MINKRLINTGVEAAPAAFDPLQNFETVTYTGNGGTQKITGYIRKGAAFNGTTSSYIDYAPLESFFHQKQTFTLSLWFYTSSTNSGGGTLFTDYAVNSFNILAYINNGNIVVESRYASAGTSYTSSATYLNAWTHLCVTSDGTTRKVYVNGNLESTQTLSTNGWSSSYSDNRVQSGALFNDANNTQNNPYNGKIDQVRIFDKALSSSEVTTLYGETYASATKSTTDIFGDGSGVALYELDEDANDTGGTYNGTPTNVNFLGMAFQPDLVWIKDRDTAYQHNLYDSVRGATKAIESQGTSAEYTLSGLTSFDSNGFTLGSNAGNNQSSSPNVAWCWKAGGAPTPNNNTQGTITSTVSANVDAGFSIVKYTGTSANATAGHGLSSAPELVLYKNLDTNSNWTVYSSVLTDSHYLKLNTTDAKISEIYNIFNGQPDSSVLKLGSGGSINNNGNDFIAYCFHSVDGYQRIGSYQGNGGVKTIYTDSNGDNTGTGAFQPRWVLIKNVDDDLSNWMIYDTIRDTDGTVGKFLEANTSDIEFDTSSAYIAPNSTGFTTGNSNSIHLNKLSKTFIYLAIA